MIKTLTNVGNSQAVIIPKALINKYQLDRLSLKETKEGILIIPEGRRVSFQEKVEMLRKNKAKIYGLMKLQAEDPKMAHYYEHEIISDIDLDIED